MEENKYLRVTDIIKRLCAPLPPDVEIMSKAKGEIGTRVHAMIEDSLSGKIGYDKDFGAREQAFFVSWMSWFNSLRPHIVMKEQRLFCEELMITGQVDAVMLIDDKPVLVDYKTSSAEGKLADGTSSWAMQAHFYHYLLTQNFIEVSDKMLFVQLRDQKDVFLVEDDQKRKIKPSELSQLIKDFSEEDQNIIQDKLKTVGWFEFNSDDKKRKIIVEYSPKIAKVFEYKLDDKITSRCIQEAKLAWSEIWEK